ncbi:MAG: hypothetical protein ACT4O0_18080 [Pseudonocardia sp.]
MNDERWLDDPRHVRLVARGVYLVCGLLLLADLLYVKSTKFSFEGWFGFYALFGFVVSFTLVLTAKELRRVLRRDEDYYERRGEGSDDG